MEVEAPRGLLRFFDELKDLAWIEPNA